MGWGLTDSGQALKVKQQDLLLVRNPAGSVRGTADRTHQDYSLSHKAGPRGTRLLQPRECVASMTRGWAPGIAGSRAQMGLAGTHLFISPLAFLGMAVTPLCCEPHSLRGDKMAAVASSSCSPALQPQQEETAPMSPAKEPHDMLGPFHRDTPTCPVCHLPPHSNSVTAPTSQNPLSSLAVHSFREKLLSLEEGAGDGHGMGVLQAGAQLHRGGGGQGLVCEGTLRSLHVELGRAEVGLELGRAAVGRSCRVGQARALLYCVGSCPDALGRAVVPLGAGWALPRTSSLRVPTQDVGASPVGPSPTFRPPGDACLSYHWGLVTLQPSLLIGSPPSCPWWEAGVGPSPVNVSTQAPRPWSPSPALCQDLAGLSWSFPQASAGNSHFPPKVLGGWAEDNPSPASVSPL